MNPRTALVALAAGAILLTGCAGGEDQQVEALKKRVAELEQVPWAAAPPPEAPVSVAPAPEPTAVEPVEATVATPEAAPTVDFAMPEFRGVNLQDAQDRVQELGVFFSVSHDMRGSRSQLLDSNWQVCDQTPVAGTRITGPTADWEGKIDFGVLKLTESCP